MDVKVVKLHRKAPLILVEESSESPVSIQSIRESLGMVTEERASDSYIDNLIRIAEAKTERDLGGRAIRAQTKRFFCYNQTPEIAFALPEPPRGLANNQTDIVDNAVTIYTVENSGEYVQVPRGVYTIRGYVVSVVSNQQWPNPTHSYMETWAMDVKVGFEVVPNDVQYAIIEHVRHLFDPEQYSMPSNRNMRWYFTRPPAEQWGGWSY